MSSNKDGVKNAEQFLAELGRGIPDHERVMVGYASEATTQQDTEGKKLHSGWWPRPHRPGRDSIQTSNNCYACISSSIKTQDPRPGKEDQMRYWRGEASFGHGLALMVDDIGDGSGSKGGLSVDYLSRILPPTVVVETSPGNHQLWYFFDAPEPNMRRFKNFLVAFVHQVLSERGGDWTIRDVSRYGRMPAGINNKRHKPEDGGGLKYPGKYGHEVALVTADYSRRYSMDSIASAFGFAIPEPAPPRTPTAAELGERSIEQRQLEVATIVLSNAKCGEGAGGQVLMNGSGKYRIQCSWGDEHGNGDTYGAYFRGPIPGAEHEFVFGCSHDTCRKVNKRTWATFVDFVVLPAILGKLEEANANPLTLDELAYAAAIEREQEEARATYLAGLKERARAARPEVAA
ncbi:DNA-primase RepB domain-containing protein [Variovorax sp. J2P1-59]|uniref:DNA-primase RepB domain-containing protein n=1 Tax=Variovorax flavidus TaxID=3053501 RepID=UPI0025759717|nr:DNA-primase RepB domain-containing protein [Variovorax sp. J2P1-59]MDM0074419.1 DNA-primase RepB domain-containing protein [Variovorax sp. J2P1-59]